MAELGDDEARGFASPACLMHDVDPTYAGLGPSDAENQRAAILRWRKAERARLIALRLEGAADLRARLSRAIFARLDGLLPDLEGRTVSLYWPFRGEPDPRDWADAIRRRGAAAALPVVTAKGAPLAFRAWRPEGRLVPGVWGIPVPESGPDVTPDVVLAPVVGFDPSRFRLGYGGGFFDRKLAAFPVKPRVVGVGYALAAIPTIYPLPHDVPMDLIVTDEGVV